MGRVANTASFIAVIAINLTFFTTPTQLGTISMYVPSVWIITQSATMGIYTHPMKMSALDAMTEITGILSFAVTAKNNVPEIP
jgi:hypothetical protein